MRRGSSSVPPSRGVAGCRPRERVLGRGNHRVVRVAAGVPIAEVPPPVRAHLPSRLLTRPGLTWRNGWRGLRPLVRWRGDEAKAFCRVGPPLTRSILLEDTLAHDSLRPLDAPLEPVTDYLLHREQGRLTESDLKVGRVIAASDSKPTTADEYPDENVPGD